MSGIGFGELIILLVIGLIVLGPERLPRVANQLGGWLGQARRMTRVMKRQLEDELNLDKEFEIIPPARTKHASLGFQAPTATSAMAAGAAKKSTPNEEDDTWSAAHDAASKGTGVGDTDEANEVDTAAVAEPATPDEPATDSDTDRKAADENKPG